MARSPHLDRQTARSPVHVEQASGGCRWSVGHEGRDLTLTFACKGCAQKGPVASPRCLQQALEALASEQGVDTIVMAGHIETQIQAGGMAVLDKLAILANDLNHLSMRQPPAGSRDCVRCGAHPGQLFNGLRTKLLSDPPEFPSAMKDALAGVHQASGAPFGAACGRCLADTSGDLAFVAESFEGLARFIMKQGFQIVV